MDLGLLIPGSVTPPQSGFLTAPLRGQGSFAFNTAGNREDTVNFMVNGVNLNDMVQNQITFQPSINTVQEFKVDNSTYSAEYGRNSGAIVNIATRSGTNDLHGEVFEFLRNDALDGRNFFNKEFTSKGVFVRKSPFKRNNFGAAVGGPIWKDHTFFFASYEGLRQRQGLTLNSTVFTDAERASVTNPTILNLLPLIPHANNGTSGFLGSAVAPVNIDQGTADISHNFNSNDRLHFYYALQEDLRQEPTLQGNTVPGFGDTRQSRRQIFTLNETHVVNSNLVNEARLGFNRIHITFTPNAQLNPATLGIGDGINTAFGIPQFSFNNINLNFGGPSGFPQGRGDTTGVLSDTVSWLRGKHNFRFGGEYRRFLNGNFSGDAGSLFFNSNANFLSGQVDQFIFTPGEQPSRISTAALGFFGVDSYKVTPFLTLELGLRYDWNGTPAEARNRFVVFDPTTDSLVQVGNGIGNIYNQSASNIEPRLGFAWDLFHDGKTILRAGYGYNVDQPVTNSVTGLASNPPFTNPINFTDNPKKGVQPIPISSLLGMNSAGSLSPATINHNFKNAYVQQWNLNIQHEITPSLGLQIGYFGSKGSHLRFLRNLNQINPSTGLRPFAALSSSSAIAPGALLANINDVDSGGNSNYNALWVTGTKRVSHGLEFNASYTFSKSLDYNSLNSQGIVLEDSTNPRLNYGPSDFDARHRFVISALYELPFHGNRAVEGWQLSTITSLQSGNPFNIRTNALFSGVRTARPSLLGASTINVVNQLNTNLASTQVGNIQYFSTPVCSATVTTDCFFSPNNQFGTLSRNAFFGPAFKNADFSILKNTRITERFTSEFRVEFFDLLNHPNFGQPNGVVGSSSFGFLTNTRFPTGDSGSSRQIQFALKLKF